ncbi:hypothetical protein NFI96_020168, partial [Prochilodus magdalenae]
QSEHDIISGHRPESGSDDFPEHLTLEDLQKPDAGKASSCLDNLERSNSPKKSEWRTCSGAHNCDYQVHSVRDMENETQLRRKLNTVRQENSSLVLENRQLINDLEATHLELASSRSKIRLLGSSVGLKSSSVSVMKDHIQDLESQLESQTKALLEAEQKLAASEQTAVQRERAVAILKEELKAVKAELSDKTRQWKRTEQQRNQALQNAEKLTVAFKDYKGEVTEKLKKVVENEGKLKASLIECDREREELEDRCKELEREKERMGQNLRELKESRDRAESNTAERLELQGQLQQASKQLGCLQRELVQKEAQLVEVSGLRREREDLRLLSACQEQRLAQAQREMEQGRAELASLESILDMLHLRENREGSLCMNPCLLPSLTYTATTEHLKHNPGERYQKLLAVLQTVEKEKTRQASTAQNLQERLTKAQEEISSLQNSITQRASHYQQLHNQLLDKAAQATTLEKELKKKNSRLSLLEKQLQEKTAAYSQVAMKTSQLEQELLERDSSIHHYQSVLSKRQREHQQALEKSKLAEENKSKDLEDRIEVLGISQSSVCKALKKNCSKRTNCSGVRKTSARDNKQLRKIAVSNRFKSDLWNKQTGADVSRSTTYRRLRELGFKSRVPAVKPMLNKKQMEKRLKWAKEHGEWTAEDWQKVVFSDESRFCISFGDQGPRVWRRGGETYNHECVKRSVKFPQSVMVWGCMSARGVGELCFLKKTVNAAVYQDVLETFLIPTVEEQFGEEDFIFQQDLAPAHAAKSTKDWFTKKQLEVLAWPANSPDLNVIENLWAIVKRKIRDRKPTTQDQLKQNIATAWEALQLSLAQSQAEGEDLRQTVSMLQLEKKEAQHQNCLLQQSVSQLSQDFEMKVKRSEEAVRSFKEQASESATKITFLEMELSSCKEELSGYLQQMDKAKQQYETQLELKNSELSALQEAVKSRAFACKSSTEENLQLQRSIQRQHSMLQESTTRIAQLEESQIQLQSQVSHLEQELERERSALTEELRRREEEAKLEVEEARLEVQKKEKQAAELSASITQLSSEMNTCRGELSEMEQELLRLRRDSNAKSSQLVQMEETLQETKGLLDKKSEMVVDLEEKLHRSEMDRRNSLQRAQLLEGQLQVVRGELSDTLDHLQELRDVLQKTQLTADERQTTIDQLAAELRASQRELEERNNEVLDMDTALKERQGELQQRAQLLGQLDVAIKERKLEMDRRVEHLQDALEKTGKKLKEKDKQVEILTERLDSVASQLQGKEDLEKSSVEYGQQLRASREQLQRTAQDLQEAHARCDNLSKHLDDLTQQARQKDAEVQRLLEQLSVTEKRHAQSEAKHQTTVTALQQELEQQREMHHKELSALQQTRGQLLKVSDQISNSLRNSQEQLNQRLQQAREQLDEAKAEAATLRAQLYSSEQLLQTANETLLIKESEITRLQAKISSLERAAELHDATLHHPTLHESSTFPSISPSLKDLRPFSPSHKDHFSRSSLCSSTTWNNASSDSSLELSESLKASVQEALRCPSSPGADWQGLNNPDLTSTSDTTFNPLTYMLDEGEAEEPDMDTLSGMLKFVNQTLALQEQHSLCSSHTQAPNEDGYSCKDHVS